MRPCILGLGTAVPAVAARQERTAEIACAIAARDAVVQASIGSLYARVGIASRASVLLHHNGGPAPEQDFFPPALHAADGGPTISRRMEVFAREAPPLAAGAAREALRDAGIGPGDITHLVTVSCTGLAAPGIDANLIRDLPLPDTVERTNVAFMGCHGAMNGLRVAGALAAADARAVVLLVAVELCSLHFHYGGGLDRMIANALFADGAGAAVIGAPRGRAPLWEVAASGSRLFPGSAEAMTWRIGDHGFEMTLSPQVPGLLRAELRPWIESWLDNRATDRRSGRSVPSQHGPPELTLADIRAFAIHPGGPKILDAAAAALALSDQALTASREILNRHGNMSSPTILFILDRLRREAVRGSASTPAPLLALAFGPGLTAEAALLLSAL